MGVFAGPEINESGLVLSLDAGNTKSYDSNENLLPYSVVSTTTWGSIVGSTVTNNATTAPDGTNTAARIQVNTSGYVAVLNNTVTAGQTYTFSFWVKSVSGSSGTWGVNWFENVTGHNRTTVNITGEWQRVSITFTPTQNSINVYVSDDRSLLGTILDGYVWGVQLERATTPSAYYPTTGTAKTRGTTLIDRSGLGNNGTLSGGVGYTSSDGGSLSFDGVNGGVNCGTNSVLNIGNTITANAWFYVNSNSVYQPIVSKVLSDGSLGWEFANSNGNIRLTFRPSATQINLSIAGLLVVGKWYMGTMTFDSITAKLYLNGSEVGSTSTGGPVTLNSTQPLQVGTRGIGSNWYNGNIAQVSIYNKALTASEIQQNFNALRGRFGI